MESRFNIGTRGNCNVHELLCSNMIQSDVLFLVILFYVNLMKLPRIISSLTERFAYFSQFLLLLY